MRALFDAVYECEDLISGSTEPFHVNHLKFYADSELDVTEDLLESIDHNESHLQKIYCILNLRFNKTLERYEVKIQ